MTTRFITASALVLFLVTTSRPNNSEPMISYSFKWANCTGIVDVELPPATRTAEVTPVLVLINLSYAPMEFHIEGWPTIPRGAQDMRGRVERVKYKEFSFGPIDEKGGAIEWRRKDDNADDFRIFGNGRSSTCQGKFILLLKPDQKLASLFISFKGNRTDLVTASKPDAVGRR